MLFGPIALQLDDASATISRRLSGNLLLSADVYA